MDNIKRESGTKALGLSRKLRGLTGKRLLNMALETVCLKARASRALHGPASVTIDIGNVCNLRCPLCPTGQGVKTAPHGFMKLKNFRKVVEETAPAATKASLHNWGEPLLHKNIVEMVAFSEGAGLRTQLSSNLVPLTPDLARGLLDAGLSKLFISCNGTTAESYLKYHVGGDFEKVMENMRVLLDLEKGNPKYSTRLIWLFHVFRHNENEVEDAIRTARELGIEIRVSAMRTDMRQEILEGAEAAIERDGDWIPEGEEYSLYDRENRKARRVMRFCSKPWKETVINWDGSVFPCCSVYDWEYSYGNALESGFRNVWNNEMYRSARDVISGRPPKIKTICEICKRNGYLFG